MKYLLVAEIAKKWNMSERSVRNYCAQGRVKGACLIGRLGTFQKMRRNQSVSIRGKKNLLLWWIF